MKISFLILGACGTGKTWVVKEIIKTANLTEQRKNGLYQYITDGEMVVLGKYEGSMFDGGDRLSMAIMSDNERILPELDDKIVIAEGDRFTNSRFIKDFNPIILKIKGDGKQGRETRGSQQTERHLKAIQTRVNNIQADYEFDNSSECLDFLLSAIVEPAQVSKRENNNSLFGDIL